MEALVRAGHAVRVLDAQGNGADGDVIRGIDWVTGHVQANKWPAVANMSLGGDPSPALDQALCNSIAAGITYAVAAGNDNLNACHYSPSRVVQALTVGASDENDRTAGFSNTGGCIDLYGPGVDVESAAAGGGSTVFSGTSMASPHGAGTAVLCDHVTAPARRRGGPVMCRSIRTLHNFAPPATDEEIRAAALQFVRKLSGFTRPSKANQAAFERAVDQMAQAAHELLDSLVTNAPPRERQAEAAKARARSAERYRSAAASRVS